MSEVAREAGVSIKSVSRVINKEAHVSARLRAKVETAIATLRYVPDTAARSLAGQRSFAIGVLFDNPSPNYTMLVVSGAYRACAEYQYHLRFYNNDVFEQHDDACARLETILSNNRTDGFIITPPLTDNLEVLDLLESRGVPYVRLAPRIALDRSAAVAIDEEAAAALVADYFWNLGHRRFGLVGGDQTHGSAILRGEGFLNRLRHHDPEVKIIETNGGFTFEGGIAAGRDLLSARRIPTAIFAVNDDSAAGVMVACSQFELRVPKDVSVIGFDDSWVAKSVWPNLTTIHQPIEAMAYKAACLLLDPREHDSQQNPGPIMMDYHLIERDSVGSPT